MTTASPRGLASHKRLGWPPTAPCPGPSGPLWEASPLGDLAPVKAIS